MDWRTPSLSLVHHFIHSLVLMYKFLIYFKNLIIKPVVFDFSTSESHKRYQGQCPSITAIKADSISHGPIALTPKVIVSLTQSQQLLLSFLVVFFFYKLSFWISHMLCYHVPLFFLNREIANNCFASFSLFPSPSDDCFPPKSTTVPAFSLPTSSSSPSPLISLCILIKRLQSLLSPP